jgi:molecular chaperone DnaK
MEELGDKLEEADKTELQGKIDALKETLKGEDIDAIKAAQEELMKKFYEVSEKIYKAAAPEQGAPDAGNTPPAGDDGYYNGEVH